jgi:hypothetical protein
MTDARNVLKAELQSFDGSINGQTRPEPSYNILKADQTAASIRI